MGRPHDAPSVLVQHAVFPEGPPPVPARQHTPNRTPPASSRGRSRRFGRVRERLTHMPSLAAFPKAWMDQLCRTGTLSLDEWLDMAASLGIDGVELYSGMIDLQRPSDWPRWRAALDARGLVMPMLCCSPDFAHPDADFRRREIEREKHWIDMTAALGGRFCRVLSGQRRPELDLDHGVNLVVDCIVAC